MKSLGTIEYEKVASKQLFIFIAERMIVMLLVNTDFIPGKEIEALGLVSGVGVPPIKIRFTTAAWGEVIEEGVERATQSMIKKAEELGANAIIRVFYDKESSESGVRVMVWGTAVRFW